MVGKYSKLCIRNYILGRLTLETVRYDNNEKKCKYNIIELVIIERETFHNQVTAEGLGICEMRVQVESSYAANECSEATRDVHGNLRMRHGCQLYCWQ